MNFAPIQRPDNDIEWLEYANKATKSYACAVERLEAVAVTERLYKNSFLNSMDSVGPKK